MVNQKVFILVMGLLCGSQGQDSGEGTHNVEYPCKSTDDLDCIRDFLAQYGQCQRTSHEDGMPLKAEDFYTYVPSQNVSISTKDTTVTMSGTKILDFYLNKDSNNLIITVDFDVLYFETPRATFNVAQIGKEPISVTSFVNITYSATNTIIVAWGDKVRPEDVRATGYVKDGHPPFFVGPEVTQNTNPIIHQVYNGVVHDLPTVVRELMLTKAYYFACLYLNQYLCNFGFVYDGRINRE